MRCKSNLNVTNTDRIAAVYFKRDLNHIQVIAFHFPMVKDRRTLGVRRIREKRVICLRYLAFRVSYVLDQAHLFRYIIRVK
jgi:hypothetical protein